MKYDKRPGTRDQGLGTNNKVFGPWSVVHGLLSVFLFFTLLNPIHAQSPSAGLKLPTEETPEPAPAAAADQTKEEEETKPGDELVYLNVQDQDIKEVVKQISKMTSRNFILDSKVSGKVTILSNKMMSKEEAYQAFLSALQVAGFTTVAGPGGVLKIVPTRDAKNFPIPTHIDTTPYTDSYITRLIKLDNISANDMSEAIKGLISKDGNLFAYPETNTLVLTDSGTNIDRLMKIIKELDQEGPQQVVEIIPLHYAGAKELSSIVLSLFEEQKKAAGGRPGGGGGALEEIAQVSKIIADERTNSIIVLASKRSIDKVKELINKLDAKLEEGAEGKIHVHYLKYAKAKDITGVLQGLAGVAAKPPGQGGAEKGPVIAELEDFKVAADDTTNSLLITSTAKTYNTLVDKVLSKLDIPRKQVYLEAMVIEFFLSRKKSFGVSAHGGGAGGNMLGFGETINQLAGLFNPFDPTNAGSQFLNAPGILGGVISGRTVDVKINDKDGAQKTITIPAFSAFLTALKSFGDTNIVASPNLLALDNEESSIEINRQEPEAGQQTNIAGVGLQTGPPTRVKAGLTLKLTPQITEGGAVRMKIDQTFSYFSPAKDPSIKSQAIAERKVATSVITNDGDTVVIGGMMQDQVTFDKTKVPLLGDIPILGYLFQKSTTVKDKSNLLLFLTPHIIRDSGDFAKVLQRKMTQQNEFLSKNYKKGEKSSIETTIKTHNKDLLDILEKAAPPSSATSPATSAEEGQRSSPVITAKPEEEKRPVIFLPAGTPLPETKEVKVEKKVEIQKVETQKAAQTNEQSTRVEIIPPRPVKKQAQAQPVESDIVETPAPKSKPAKAATPKTAPAKSQTQHAPVITLPQGTSPDLSE